MPGRTPLRRTLRRALVLGAIGTAIGTYREVRLQRSATATGLPDRPGAFAPLAAPFTRP